MMMSHKSKERGFIAVTYALVAAVLLGFAGLAVDVGYMQWNKRRAQAAADSAAMGALRQLELGKDLATMTTAGLYSSSLNGFANGGDTTVTISKPPIHGSYAGVPTAVEADVTRVVPSFFMRIFGTNNVTVAAHAVARTMSTEGSIGGCIFALAQGARSGLKINGTNMQLNTSCSAVVDSSDDNAFTMGSGVTFRLSNGAQVGVQGGWSISGGASLVSVDGSGNTHPLTPNHNGVYTDPLTSYVAPTASGLTVRSNSGVTYGKNNPPSSNTIQPGIYCGGIAVNDTNGVTYTFAPGLYVLAGGGFSLNSNAWVNGTGVTFYNTTGSSAWGCPNSAAGPLKIVSQAIATLSAPEDAGNPMQAMLFFQDRSVTGSSNDASIAGGGNSTFDGALYFKGTGLSFAGNNTTTGFMVLVADTISINGNTTLGNNYTSCVAPCKLAPATTGGGLVQ
jgi:Flp pilus assembly protein TadG